MNLLLRIGEYVQVLPELRLQEAGGLGMPELRLRVPESGQSAEILPGVRIQASVMLS